MPEIIHTRIAGSRDKPIQLDFRIINSDAPVIVFCHGYKGFKDWGAWDLVSSYFAKKGFNFLKFNFSHNGCSDENITEFVDLDAFGRNNYSIELNDLGKVIDWVDNTNLLTGTKRIGLIGHSRGGAITILKSRDDARIQAFATWAGISDLEIRFPFGSELLKWKDEGVYYVTNGRTKQEMPHYFQFYSDYMKNRERLDIRKTVKNNKTPFLIVHGSQDEAVHFTEAMRLKKWCLASNLEVINNANHTFGSKHPWEEESLPKHLEDVCDLSLDFFKEKFQY